jgi:hypothetical protein
MDGQAIPDLSWLADDRAGGTRMQACSVRSGTGEPGRRLAGLGRAVQ